MPRPPRNPARAAARAARKQERVERRTTKKVTRIANKAQRKFDKIDRRRARFGLDPITGRPTEGDEPQAVTDPAGQTYNIFNVSAPEGGGQNYPVGSMAPERQPTITDRTKLDLAGQVGNL
jgi:hypothetical protein